LRNAVKGPVNFAGEYVLATWGCGTSCLTGAAVNARTGQVIFLPHSVCCWNVDADNPMDYRAESSLIIFTGLLNEEDPNARHYFELRRGRFEFIQREAIVVNSSPPVDVIVPSNTRRERSSGADRPVTEFTLINDADIDVTIYWLDGNAIEVESTGGEQTKSHPWISRGDSWRVEYGAKTWESHWFAVVSNGDFICSFSPRQNEIARLSEMDGCKSAFTINNPQTVPATCPSGYVLNGGQCERDVVPAPTCLSGYIFSKGQCVRNSTNSSPPTQTVEECAASCERRKQQCDRELKQRGDALGWDNDQRQGYWDTNCVPEFNACLFACNPKGPMGPADCRYTRDGGQICS
jgi:hypothetical protein